MRSIIVFLLSICMFSANAQTSDEQLNKRLNEYLRLSKQLNFTKLIDYMHPSLFNLTPKELIVESMEKAFNDPSLRITIDSISVAGVSPIFKYEGRGYHKINYYMVMKLKFADASAFEDSAFVPFMLKNLQEGFGDKTVTFNKKESTFEIRGNDLLFSVKDDPGTPWMFIGYNAGEEEVLKTLLPMAVITKFELN